MNRKKIIHILDKKFRKWTKSIDDKEIRKMVERDAFVTGGAIVSLLADEKPKDLDIYFKTYETTLAVARYYANRWSNFEHNCPSPTVEVIEDEETKEKRIKIFIRSAGIADESEDEKKKGKDTSPYRPVFLSANAITLDGGIQLVTRFYGEPEEVHKNFDFVHCTNIYFPYKKELKLNPKALESFIFKELQYVGSRYPIASILRSRKFINRGWKINAGQYLKMVFQLQKFDLTNPYVLEDQLNGVDLLYMTAITDKIRKDTEENPDMEIDGAYLVTVVEKIFDNDKSYDARFDADNDGSELLDGEEEN